MNQHQHRSDKGCFSTLVTWLAILCFLAVFASNLFLGGGAYGGKVEGDIFLLGQHGEYTEVSPSIYYLIGGLELVLLPSWFVMFLFEFSYHGVYWKGQPAPKGPPALVRQNGNLSGFSLSMAAVRDLDQGAAVWLRLFGVSIAIFLSTWLVLAATSADGTPEQLYMIALLGLLESWAVLRWRRWTIVRALPLLRPGWRDIKHTTLYIIILAVPIIADSADYFVGALITRLILTPALLVGIVLLLGVPITASALGERAHRHLWPRTARWPLAKAIIGLFYACQFISVVCGVMTMAVLAKVGGSEIAAAVRVMIECVFALLIAGTITHAYRAICLGPPLTPPQT